MWPKLGNFSIPTKNFNFIRIWPEKALFFEGWSWFKFNNLGLAQVTDLKFYTSVAKGLKPKVRKFLGLIPTFVEVKREKLVEGGGQKAESWIGLREDFPYLWFVTLKNVCKRFIFSRPEDLQSAALLNNDFCWSCMGFLHSSTFFINRDNHREIFYRNACPTKSWPTTYLLCTCCTFP